MTTPTGRPSSSTTTPAPCARLGSSDSASATVCVGTSADRGVEHQVPPLDPADDLGHDVDRDVLRDDHQAAAAGDGLGHPAAGDGGHVGDDERDGGARPVRRPQVDRLAGPDRAAARHHEDVVVRQVVRGPDIVEESHTNSLTCGFTWVAGGKSAPAGIGSGCGSYAIIADGAAERRTRTRIPVPSADRRPPALCFPPKRFPPKAGPPSSDLAGRDAPRTHRDPEPAAGRCAPGWRGPTGGMRPS